MDQPQPPINFPARPFDTVQRAKAAIANTRKVEDDIAASVSVDHASFENVLLPLIFDENARRCEERVLGLFSSVHPVRTGLADSWITGQKAYQ
jgi:metallopeptidase MepB